MSLEKPDFLGVTVQIAGGDNKSRQLLVGLEDVEKKDIPETEMRVKKVLKSVGLEASLEEGKLPLCCDCALQGAAR